MKRARAMLMGAVLTLAVASTMSTAPSAAMADQLGDWSDATRVEDAPGTDPAFNGPSLDGFPFISPDSKSFYMASNRVAPGSQGGIDIWVSARASADDPWGAPVNLGPGINSPQNDFCPTMARDGKTLYFVSNRPGFCGGDDIFVSRLRPDGWDEPVNLGCDPVGPNSSGNEAGPFPFSEPYAGPSLYFSSTRSGNSELYRSLSHGGAFRQAAVIGELSDAASTDGQPNVRRDGLEIFFFSNRPGSQGNDIWSATRSSTSDPWSAPVNLGSAVNSAASETRPSLSWDGTTLYFGSNRPGSEGDADHYVSTRARQLG
jgi:Tol biopolymer transport system component